MGAVRDSKLVKTLTYSSIAQLAEQSAVNRPVLGSSPNGRALRRETGENPGRG